jgi:hypothetical protein
MDGSIVTLHDFMVHTKAVIYILIVVFFVGITWWWCFLTEGDDDIKK